MTQIPSTQIYGIGIGSASTSPFITHFIGRSPTTSDINYSIQSRWVNTVTSDEYILQSFSTVAGVTTANWVNLATGSVDLLTFNANSGSAVPASAVINLVGTGAISTSATGDTVTTSVAAATTAALGVASFDPTYFSVTAGAVTLLSADVTTFAGDTGTATPSLGTITISGAGVGLNTTASGASVNISGVLTLAHGGTNANLTASNGGIFYSTATAGAILSGTATARQVLLSGSSTTPAWSTATYPSTTTINQILYSSSANVIGGITTANNGLLITGTTGIPSILANGTAGYVLTAQSGAPPAWAAASGGGITTIDGDSGSVTGSTVTITSGSSNNSGSSVTFSGSSSTLTFNVTDANTNTVIGNSSNAHTSHNSVLYGSGIAFGGTLTGNDNIAVGNNIMQVATTAAFNVFLGHGSGAGVTTAGKNVGIGYSSLGNGTLTGSYNCALGYNSGTNYATSEADNILINNAGTASESNALHIGAGTGTGNQQLNKAFISGIYGITTTSGTTSTVLVSDGDQLGTVSSSARFKRDIQDMKDQSSSVMRLRPVTFHYKKHVDGIKQFGLIAEEVNEIMPEIVNLDEEGLPFSVRYHDIPIMLLNEMQKMADRIAYLESLL